MSWRISYSKKKRSIHFWKISIILANKIIIIQEYKQSFCLCFYVLFIGGKNMTCMNQNIMTSIVQKYDANAYEI